jgi:hypothetical protein
LPADQQEQNRLFFLKETGAERYITHAWWRDIVSINSIRLESKWN